MKIRAWAALAAVAFAQPQERPQFRASSQLVLVPVQVTTQAGKTVESLSEADFELYDSGVMRRFRLEPDLAVRKMSRGNRQKVALVLALAHSPKLLVLDEPTSGLDPLMQDTLMLCLRELAADGHTVMFSSHTLSEVETLCDRIAIVREGRIVEDSTLSALKAQAPRQIVVTLTPEQPPDQITWPTGVAVRFQPGHCDGTASASMMIAPSLRHRSCVLELHGTSVAFMQWAATQNFADVIIGPPALEVLFRRYYESG